MARTTSRAMTSVGGSVQSETALIRSCFVARPGLPAQIEYMSPRVLELDRHRLPCRRDRHIGFPHLSAHGVVSGITGLSGERAVLREALLGQIREKFVFHAC